VKARGARVFVITDNPRLARGIDDHPIVIPDNGPLTALIAVLPLQVRYLVLPFLCYCTLSLWRFLCAGAVL
jgi:hypothetical protein